MFSHFQFSIILSGHPSCIPHSRETPRPRRTSRTSQTYRFGHRRRTFWTPAPLNGFTGPMIFDTPPRYFHTLPILPIIRIIPIICFPGPAATHRPHKTHRPHWPHSPAVYARIILDSHLAHFGHPSETDGTTTKHILDTRPRRTALQQNTFWTPVRDGRHYNKTHFGHPSFWIPYSRFGHPTPKL